MTVTTLENEHLVTWQRTFEAQRERMHALTRRLAPEAFSARPAPDRWSAGQCIDHLTVSMRIYLDLMEPVIERAAQKGDPPYDRGPLLGRLLLRALRAPGRRYPAPRSFQPRRRDLGPDDVREDFDRQMDRMQRALARGGGLALGHITMPWPVLRLVKISLAQAFELQTLHNDRHLDQAERAVRADDAPG